MLFSRISPVLLCTVFVTAMSGVATAFVSPLPAPTSAYHSVVTQMLGIPLQFEANQGQVDDQVEFLARGKGYTLFLTSTESVMVLAGRDASRAKGNAGTDQTDVIRHESREYKQSVVRMKFEGANPSPVINGIEKLPGVVNYILGNDPAEWRMKIPTYAKVHYKEAYPGIDLAYYGNQGKLEYDFIVAPGADPSQIKLAFEGASEIKVADSGDLLLTTTLGEVKLQKPIVYQLEKDGHKTLVAGKYIFLAESAMLHASRSTNHEISISLAAYDASKPLIIDPVLSWSTYLGGSINEVGYGIAVDTAGSAYVTGGTNSLNFPVTVGSSIQSSCCGPQDIFVTKLNPAGTAIVYSTYLGGSGDDMGRGIAVDAAGSAYVNGFTRSPNFPVVGSLIQSMLGSSFGDAFVIKLNPTGTALIYSTYLCGSTDNYGLGIAVDAAGSAYVTGFTYSSNFPGTAGSSIQNTSGGSMDAFVTKLNPTGTAFVYSTYLGGTGSDVGYGIAVDAAGSAYVTGTTGSLNFPGTAGSLIQSTMGSFDTAFVTKINPAGTALVYSTYLGGSSGDRANGIAVDSTGNAYVTGHTFSSNFPVTAGSYSQSLTSSRDAFITKINSAGTALVYSTYLGGNGADEGNGIAVDSTGNAYVIGQTTHPSFPVTTENSIQSTWGNGVSDAFVAKINPAGTALAYSTYLGGNGRDQGLGIAVDATGGAYVTGITESSNFPGTTGSLIQSTSNPADAFVAKISFTPTASAGPDQPVVTVPPASPAPPILMGTLVTLDGTASSGSSLTFNWTQLPGGPTVALSGATTAHPTFTAPNVPAAGATVTFQLIACEGTSSNCSDPDTVNVHIMNVNRSPVAEAGPDQTVQEGSPVMLNGSASYDPDVESITYTWLQVFGPQVTLVYPNTNTPSFTAPPVGASGGQVDFELIVTDARGVNHSDFVSVFISNVNQPPVGNAGPDQTRNENTLVTLDGSASTDPDLDTIHFSWSQISGPGVSLTGANTSSPTFTAPNVGPGGALLTFQLVVNDGQLSGGAATVRVQVQDVNDPPVCSLAQPSVSVLWPPNHTMVEVSILGVTDPNNSAVTISYPRVTQDEPINGLGDGDTSPDAVESGNNILLRAERTGSGNGRVYAVQFRATDPDGVSCTGTVRVSVPKSIKDTAIDSGQTVNSFGP